jgi:hypothetical protein
LVQDPCVADNTGKDTGAKPITVFVRRGTTLNIQAVCTTKSIGNAQLRWLKVRVEPKDQIVLDK